MIFQVTLDDIAEIVQLLKPFYRHVYETEYNTDRMMDGIKHCLGTGDFSFISVKDGSIQGVFIGMLTYNLMMDKSMVQEVVWYAEDNSGYSLLKAAIEAARKHEVDYFHHTMIEPVDPRAHKLLTKRIGFSPLERSYLMKL